jgi:ribosome-associated translation inhibitor RaiA
MALPLEITFHNMRSSRTLASVIEKRVAKLEKLYGRLVSCRVSIEARGKHHRTGNVYEIHVEMNAPGGLIVVSREPHHVKERHATTDIRVSLHDAFEAAEARLRSFAKKQRGKPRQRDRIRLSEATRGPDVAPAKNPRARTRTPPPLSET